MTITHQRQEIAIILTDYSNDLVDIHGNFYDQTKILLEKSIPNFGNFDIKSYDAQIGHLPNLSSLGDTIKAIWVTGSAHDAFSNDEWIINLTSFLTNVITNSLVPVVGICFGHQIIGRAIGGDIGRNEKGWELGIEKININSQDEEIKDLFQNIATKENNFTFDIIEVHQDIVKSVPKGYKIIGSTEKTEIQGLYKKNTILTFQGHPEFDKPVVQDITVNAREKGNISKEVLHKSLTDLKEKTHDGLKLTNTVIAKFMGI